MLLGEIGLTPTVYKSLSWPDVDNIIIGHERRHQRQQELPRMLAWQQHNAFAKPEDVAPTPAAFWPLPLVDRAAPLTSPAETQEAFFDRLRARGLTPVP